VTARDEGEAFVLLKNAQVLSERANAINEIQLRLEDPNDAPAVAARAEAQLGYKSVSWQEANESVLEALIVRNAVMYTVVAAIMLVAGFGIFNIVSTITHEKARDIAILKSLGFPQGDMQRLFVRPGGTRSLGYVAPPEMPVNVPSVSFFRPLNANRSATGISSCSSCRSSLVRPAGMESGAQSWIRMPAALSRRPIFVAGLARLLPASGDGRSSTTALRTASRWPEAPRSGR
jgi:hypothetical protein